MTMRGGWETAQKIKVVVGGRDGEWQLCLLRVFTLFTARQTTHVAICLLYTTTWDYLMQLESEANYLQVVSDGECIIISTYTKQSNLNKVAKSKGLMSHQRRQRACNLHT